MIRVLLTFLIFVWVAASAFGQECPGGLGENLFTAGDFGSGQSNNISIDPMLAPGYRYVRDGSPSDGEYIITNDMGRWSFLFGTWLPLKDNSSDPNGYMMVVNASFEPGLFYEEEIDGLCDNTSYEFSADIINVVKREITGHSDPNVDFLINDEVVLGTGNIRQNESWNTYSFSFNTAPGQTSVKLSLRNNAPGGTGNDLALDNISFRACGPLSEVGLVDGDKIVCQEDLPLRLVALIEGVEDVDRRYQWEVSTDNSNWDVIPGQESSQLLYDDLGLNERSIFRYSTAASIASFANEKCRFFSDTVSVFAPQREFMRFDTICGGTSLELNGALLIEPGVYMEALTSQFGCDSIVTIQLDTVRRETLTAEVDGIDPNCNGQPIGIISASLVSGGFPPYNLNIEGVDYAGLVANDLLADTYDVLVEDRFNCFAEATVTLIDPPLFTIDLGPDLDLFLGEEVQIDISSDFDLTSITWPEELSDFNNESSFTLLPLSDSQLIAMAIADGGCEASDTINISLDTDVSIYIPNVFSPNGDLINDTYFISPFGRSLGGINYFNVYDRWGGLLWQYTDESTSWDGTTADKQDVAEGIYPYVMEGYLINGDPVKASGTVMLVR